MKITPTPFLVVLSAVLGIGALALLFIYLPYDDSKEAESMRQSLEARKAAELASKQAPEAAARAAKAEAQLAQKNLDAAAAKSREREARLQALEGRRQNFERQAEELQQKRMQSWNERQARQRRLEQEREVQKNQNQ
jgi:uncharacterized membrane protein YdfJ with MMPL/SSD domain